MPTKQQLEILYNRAHEMASQNPQIGAKLAGNCTNISYGMLHEARQLLGDDVRLVIGWFRFLGNDQFYFSDETLNDWMNGIRKEKYNIHCWLAKGEKIIDLTLPSTLNEIDSTMIHEEVKYIDSKKADELNITYVEKMSGDEILFKIGLAR